MSRIASNPVNFEGDLVISDLVREAAEKSLQIDVMSKVNDTIDSSYVSGRIYIQEVQPGLTCTLNAITSHTDEVYDVLGDPLITCNVTLAGKIENAAIDGYGVVENPLHRGTLIGFGRQTKWQRPTKAGQYFKSFGFTLRQAFFDAFTNKIADDGLDVFAPFRDDPRAVNLPFSQKLLDLGNEAFTHPYTGALEGLFHESNTVKFLLETMSLLREEAQLIRKIGRKSYDKLIHARTILDKELVNPPKTLDLARRVEININRLQEYFKIAFGTTIFGYVRSQRLNIARVLITEYGLGSAETGYRVGFSSPAAFTAAYRRRFGHPPSQR